MLHSVGVGRGRIFVTWASGRKLEASSTSKEFVLALVPDLIRKEDITVIEYVDTTPLFNPFLLCCPVRKPIVFIE
jgi:hypothetical protein